MEEVGQTIAHAVELQVDDDVLVNRIVGRAEEARKAGQPVRADDNAESLKVRLMAYYKQTSPLIGYYHAKGLLRGVDGLGAIEDVQRSISATLDS